MDGFGLIQVYTGEGKGKTTAALGLCLRASGRGKKAIILQFIKAGGATGEIVSIKRLYPYLKIRQLGRSLSFIKGKPSPEDIKTAAEGWRVAKDVLSSGRYDIVVLDEINVALDLELLDTDSVLEDIKKRAPGVEVVMTGRNAPNKVIEAADLLTEMKAVKHPYEKGIPARAGIEY